MTTSEKISFLQCYVHTNEKPYESFEDILRLAEDSNDMVRSLVASLLVHFECTQSKATLLRLAKDKNDLVRSEAYDSLTLFPCMEVLSFLVQSIQEEPSELARSYAVLSWTDIVLSLKHELTESIAFAKKQYHFEKNSECKLSWCYALYCLGQDKYLDELFVFLKHVDYIIQCRTLSLLRDIMRPDNVVYIKNNVEELLKISHDKSVCGRARDVLNEIAFLYETK